MISPKKEPIKDPTGPPRLPMIPPILERICPPICASKLPPIPKILLNPSPSPNPISPLRALPNPSNTPPRLVNVLLKLPDNRSLRNMPKFAVKTGKSGRIPCNNPPISPWPAASPPLARRAPTMPPLGSPNIVVRLPISTFSNPVFPIRICLKKLATTVSAAERRIFPRLCVPLTIPSIKSSKNFPISPTVRNALLRASASSFVFFRFSWAVTRPSAIPWALSSTPLASRATLFSATAASCSICSKAWPLTIPEWKISVCSSSKSTSFSNSS